MNKEKFIEQSHLYLMNELEETEIIEFENIMLENDEFRAEFESIKNMYKTITTNRPSESEEKVLVSARYELLRTIRKEEAAPTLLEKLSGILKTIFITNYKLAAGGAGIFIVGLFVGYLFFISNTVTQPMLSTPEGVDVDKVQGGIEAGDVKISNIKIPTNITGGAQIEVSFDAIKPISYKGNADDPFIQRLLASALVTEKNPGLRLRTVNALSSQLEAEKFKIDPKVKNALLSALKVDDNPAVRREALNALMKFPFDDEIRDGYLFVLSNDHNSGMRISAINALAQLKIDGASLDDKILNVLNRKAENDESNFIRLRAASLVREVK